jgi:hypothetical protein
MNSKFSNWLQERCPEEHIASKDGVLYLPIDTCERKLDYMTREFGVTWSTRNYKSRLYEFKNGIWISASLELVLTDMRADLFSEKTLVGCATFPVANMGRNTHYDPTAKSFCTVNAAMDLGDQFGRFLSSQAVILDTNKKPAPDLIAIKKMENAIKSRNAKEIAELYSLYDFAMTEDIGWGIELADALDNRLKHVSIGESE